MKKTELKQKKKSKELGASLVEYGLLIALVALIAIPSVNVLGRSIEDTMMITALEIGAGNAPD